MILAVASLLAQTAPTYAITNVSVITPGSNRVSQNQTVAFQGDKIVWVGATGRQKLAPDTKLIDGTGKFLIPGLWDMHVHLSDAKSLGLFTLNGVTGVRAMFGMNAQLSWRKDVSEGRLLGPQMVLAGPIVDGPKPIWPGSIAVSTEEQGREAVRKVKKDGYDFVKVYSLLPRAAFFGIADECKKLGLPFAGHVPNSVGILEAQKAGQKSTEHMMGLKVECSDHAHDLHAKYDAANAGGSAKVNEVGSAMRDEITATYNPAKEAELLRGVARGSMWHVPTLVVLRNIAYLDDPILGKDDRLKYMLPFVKAGWDPTKDFRFKDRTAESWKRAKVGYESNLAFTKKMIAAKANILAGTDCLNPYVYPGFSLHDELALLVENGMTTTQALAAATTSPAKYFGWERTHGTISTGKTANMVLLTANPLADIRNTTKIDTVVQRGTVMNRATLDSGLKEREYK